jgi:hypothetical protein
MQYLAQDMAEVAELWEEVTQVQVATVMARAHTVQVEGMAREKTTLWRPSNVKRSKQPRGSPFWEMSLWPHTWLRM